MGKSGKDLEVGAVYWLFVVTSTELRVIERLCKRPVKSLNLGHIQGVATIKQIQFLCSKRTVASVTVNLGYYYLFSQFQIYNQILILCKENV